jgi:hypothetical protein
MKSQPTGEHLCGLTQRRPRLPSKNQANEPRGHLRRPHGEVALPSVHSVGKRQPRPTEYPCACSKPDVVDPGQLQSCTPVVLRTGGPYPSTARLVGPTTSPIPQYLGSNNRLVGLVPIGRTREFADSDPALALLRLRKPPAGKLVTLERVVERFEHLQKPH